MTEKNTDSVSLKEFLLGRIEAVEKGIETAHADVVRVPTEVQKQVGGLKELIETRIEALDELNEQKFKNLDKRLDLVEQARIEQKKDTATAVDAALKAAKEAVTEQNASNVLAISKSEFSTTKQIDQVSMNLNDLKDRLTRIEGMASGKSASNWVIGLIVMAGVGVAVALIKVL